MNICGTSKTSLKLKFAGQINKVGCFKDEFKNYLEMHVAVLMGLLCMKVLCDFPKKKLAPISSVGFVQKL